jgi:hypothetical protein
VIDPAMIPDEVVEAAARAEYEVWRHDCAGELALDLEMYRLWDQLEPDEHDVLRGEARAAIAAALNAWPVAHYSDVEFADGRAFDTLVLPLPQEDSDKLSTKENDNG